jgi:WS/DGAT/MGAT family acyltransferase
MPDRYESAMNSSDNTMWRIERDPALSTTIVGVSLLDHAPDWETVRRHILSVTDEIPRLRQRVVEPPLGIGPPRWVDDPDLDLEYHLRRVRLPEPGDVQAVLDLAGPIQMAGFDKTRPLWEFTLVEGLKGERAALVIKIHHSVTDGVGAIRMSKALFRAPGEHPRPKRATHAVVDEASTHRDPVRLVLDSVADRARSLVGTAEHVAAGLPGAAVAVTKDPAGTMSQVARTAQTVGRLVRPVSEPLSPVMRGRGLGRRLAAMELSLAQLRDAGHRADGTLNDAFLAALAGGMRRYHVRHGADPGAVRVTMPVNLRRDGDAAASNRFTPVRFTLPLDEADPRRRMRRLGEAARAERKAPGLDLSGQVAGLLNLLPPQATTAVLGSMLKAVDLVATNVPGLSAEVELCGAPVIAQYAFAPPSGAAFSAALLSHLDVCTLGLVVDTTAVPDTAVLAECIAEGCAEVLAVVGR